MQKLIALKIEDHGGGSKVTAYVHRGKNRKAVWRGETLGRSNQELYDLVKVKEGERADDDEGRRELT